MNKMIRFRHIAMASICAAAFAADAGADYSETTKPAANVIIKSTAMDMTMRGHLVRIDSVYAGGVQTITVTVSP